MTREEHLARIYIVGARTVGKSSRTVLLCSGPDCASAEMLAGLTVADILAEATAHVDKMTDLGV